VCVAKSVFAREPPQSFLDNSKRPSKGSFAISRQLPEASAADGWQTLVITSHNFQQALRGMREG